MKGIRTIKEANKYLRKWIEKSTHIHATTKVIPDERFKDSCFRPVPSDINLDDVFCLRVERKVRKDNTFQYNGRNFQLLGTVGRANLSGARVELHIIPRKRIRVFLEGRFLREFPYDGE